jgi:hypothetical protein
MEREQAGTAQTGTGQGEGAILHSQGGVWVNGYEARDSSAVFAGDLLETKPGFSASLTLDGATVLLQAESVAKFQGDHLVLDHGSVSVGTVKRFRVRVNCITVVPVLNEWTQYEVVDVNRTVQVAARKNDVNVDHEAGLRKAAPGTQAQHQASVHETEQKSYNETELCGAPPRVAGGGLSVSPKWIAAGATGTGILIWLLLHGGGGKTPISSWQP